MGQYCNCPVAFNITLGIFLIAVPVASWLGLWGIEMPFWLKLIMLVLGVAAIWLNTANRIYARTENLTTQEANKLHSQESL